jgi:hypothetical protein
LMGVGAWTVIPQRSRSHSSTPQPKHGKEKQCVRQLSNRSPYSLPPRLPSRTVQVMSIVDAAVAVGSPSRSSHFPKIPAGIEETQNTHSPSSREVFRQV